MQQLMKKTLWRGNYFERTGIIKNNGGYEIWKSGISDAYRGL